MKLNSKKLNLKLIFAVGAACISASALAMQANAPKPNQQMQTVLTELQNEGGKPIEKLSAKEARQQPTPADAVKSVMNAEGKKDDKNAGLAKVEDRMIQGAVGLIPARIYIPEGKAPMPMIVYYHGGGFVIANKDVYDAAPRAIARQAKAIVLSIDYRQAPEHKFPAAHDDAFAAYQWALKNAQSLGADPNHIAVAGESAGGNLAINVSMRARDQGIKLPVHQLLVYPVAGTNMNTESYLQNANAKPLGKGGMAWFMKMYTNKPSDAQDTRLNVIEANLKGLPSTTIITAEIDPLRSEGKELASRLKAQGVNVSYRNFEGVTHEFFGMAPVIDEAKKAQDFAVSELKGAFSG